MKEEAEKSPESGAPQQGCSKQLTMKTRVPKVPVVWEMRRSRRNQGPGKLRDGLYLYVWTRNFATLELKFYKILKVFYNAI